MNITGPELKREHEGLSATARRGLYKAALEAPHVDLSLLEAVASRETNMKNVVGDGGHGRGMFQQDDRFQEKFLRSVRGCRSGMNLPIYASAWMKGRVPTVAAGADRCADILEANVAECIRRKVPAGKRLSVAISGYNAGITGAINAFFAHGNADRATTGADYASDVLQRAALIRGWIK